MFEHFLSQAILPLQLNICYMHKQLYDKIDQKNNLKKGQENYSPVHHKLHFFPVFMISLKKQTRVRRDMT